MSDLTDEKKKYIDSLPYPELLERWRYAPCGNEWFRGEVGDYWKERMEELRSQPGGDQMHTLASKSVGWESVA